MNSTFIIITSLIIILTVTYLFWILQYHPDRNLQAFDAANIIIQFVHNVNDTAIEESDSQDGSDSQYGSDNMNFGAAAA